MTPYALTLSFYRTLTTHEGCERRFPPFLKGNGKEEEKRGGGVFVGGIIYPKVTRYTNFLCKGLLKGTPLLPTREKLWVTAEHKRNGQYLRLEICRGIS